MDEIQKMNAIVFWLIKKCRETNAETMTITQENVTEHGKNVGDWEVIVRRREAPEMELQD